MRQRYIVKAILLIFISFLLAYAVYEDYYYFLKLKVIKQLDVYENSYICEENMFESDKFLEDLPDGSSWNYYQRIYKYYKDYYNEKIGDDYAYSAPASPKILYSGKVVETKLTICKGFNLRLKKGRAYNLDAREAVCYKTGYKIGDIIKINYIEYKVVGILDCPVPDSGADGVGDVPQIVIPPSDDISGSWISFVVFENNDDNFENNVNKNDRYFNIYSYEELNKINSIYNKLIHKLAIVFCFIAYVISIIIMRKEIYRDIEIDKKKMIFIIMYIIAMIVNELWIDAYSPMSYKIVVSIITFTSLFYRCKNTKEIYINESEDKYV